MQTRAADAARDRDVIRAEGLAFAELAEGAWDQLVSNCPGWDLGTLVAHLGRVHRWAAANVAAGERVRLSALVAAPTEPTARTEWYCDGLQSLLDVLARTDPDTEVWTFSPTGEQQAWWWARRTAQETGMHRWDAAAAAGRSAVGFDPSVAVAGIDEYFTDFLPRLPAETFAAMSGTLHIHVDDAPGEWVLDLDEPTRPARPEHARADTAVRGAGSDVLLWLWNRQAADGHLEVFGNAEVVTGWTRVAI